MNKREVQKLNHGMYRLAWKKGGASFAAVGSLHNGRRWFAPTNWTCQSTDSIASTDWHLVRWAQLLNYPDPVDRVR
jgi:hypothetical protein